MPLQATSGAASYDAFGGGAAAVPQYIEDVFSTYLYTGTGAAQTITNEIDLSTKGGLVWIKGRSGATGHRLTDTARGVTKSLASNSTAAEATETTGLTAFGTTGFTIDTDADYNTSAATYASWTFRKQPKFFDVVTFTTDVNGYALVSHNLGSTPAFVITKTTSSGGSDWACYHKDLNGGVNAGRYIIRLTQTGAADNPVGANNWIVPTSTTLEFPAGIWLSGNTTHVAYVFASNAGGFGLTGTDNVISCGSFTTDGSGNATVSLGYEPQWLLMKNSSGTADSWVILDNMRGWNTSTNDAALFPNASSAEGGGDYGTPNATGFTVANMGNTKDFIYIAIRRGPMKVPTSGTSVFAPLTYTGNGTSGRYISGAGFPPDLIIQTARSASENREFDDRLRGGGSTAMNALFSNSTNAEATDSGSVQLLNQDGFTVRSFGNGSSVTYIGECFRRAPSFFDEVCYTGTSSARTITHNLAAVPELMIVKCRSTARAWPVYAAPLGNTEEPRLNESSASGSSTSWNSTTPTSSVFSVSNGSIVNASGDTYVAYLFATCAGVSKVGSYTGTATTKQIDCGFTAGARFVLIKRTDSTGDWYVWDTARGIVSGNDSYLLLNSTAAEVTNTDYIDTYSAGFEISSTAPAAINASAGTFVFLAIA
jgi:hypothetical protein